MESSRRGFLKGLAALVAGVSVAPKATPVLIEPERAGEDVEVDWAPEAPQFAYPPNGFRSMTMEQGTVAHGLPEPGTLWLSAYRNTELSDRLIADFELRREVVINVDDYLPGIHGPTHMVATGHVVSVEYQLPDVELDPWLVADFEIRLISLTAEA